MRYSIGLVVVRDCWRNVRYFELKCKREGFCIQLSCCGEM